MRHTRPADSVGQHFLVSSGSGCCCCCHDGSASKLLVRWPGFPTTCVTGERMISVPPWRDHGAHARLVLLHDASPRDCTPDASPVPGSDSLTITLAFWWAKTCPRQLESSTRSCVCGPGACNQPPEAPLSLCLAGSHPGKVQPRYIYVAAATRQRSLMCAADAAHKPPHPDDFSHGTQQRIHMPRAWRRTHICRAACAAFHKRCHGAAHWAVNARICLQLVFADVPALPVDYPADSVGHGTVWQAVSNPFMGCMLMPLESAERANSCAGQTQVHASG